MWTLLPCNRLNGRNGKPLFHHKVLSGHEAPCPILSAAYKDNLAPGQPETLCPGAAEDARAADDHSDLVFKLKNLLKEFSRLERIPPDVKVKAPFPLFLFKGQGMVNNNDEQDYAQPGTGFPI